MTNKFVHTLGSAALVFGLATSSQAESQGVPTADSKETCINNVLEANMGEDVIIVSPKVPSVVGSFNLIALVIENGESRSIKMSGYAYTQEAEKPGSDIYVTSGFYQDVAGGPMTEIRNGHVSAAYIAGHDPHFTIKGVHGPATGDFLEVIRGVTACLAGRAPGLDGGPQ